VEEELEEDGGEGRRCQNKEVGSERQRELELGGKQRKSQSKGTVVRREI
jgi:hypothetical protein